MPSQPFAPPQRTGERPGLNRRFLRTAARYWEFRRIVYNVALLVLAGMWVSLTWPAFATALTGATLLDLFLIAVLANVAYCVVYLVDILVQRSTWRAGWLRHRWLLWVAATVLAVALAHHWIADDVYPYVRGA